MGSKKMSVDLEFVRNLAELISETDLNEIEIEEDDIRIRLARGGTETYVSAPVYQPPSPAPASSPAQAAPAPSSSAAAAGAESGTPLPSPMVGTAYLSPSPDSDPFVTVGGSVRKGQTVMIVEAMKTMNQIASPQDGTVASIKVDDGQPVEFGQTLLTFE